MFPLSSCSTKKPMIKRGITSKSILFNKVSNFHISRHE